MAKSRSTILDKAKVRSKAWEFGIHSQHHFEIRYCNKFNKSGEHRAPNHAWNGKKLATGGAQEIAELLELETYHELEPDKELSPWTEFIQDRGLSTSFSEFIVEDPNENLKGMLDFNKMITTTDLQTVNVYHDFYFKLQGNQNESFIILLSSPTETIQLAPIGIDGFNNTLEQTSMRYPAFSISFDKDKLGWRRFLIIKGKNLPITMKHPDNFSVSAHELNTLAFKLRELDIMINIHEFILVKGD